MTTHQADVVIVGLGASGSILARELTAAGFRVLGIEKGPEYAPEDFWLKFDELRYSIRCGISPTMTTDPITWRPTPDRGQRAALGGWPRRGNPLFLPPSLGVGGGSIHYACWHWRQMAEDFRMRSVVLEHFGEEVMPEGSRIVDWPVSYDELEPFYAQVEREIGVSGQAGNIDGDLIAGRQSLRGASFWALPLPADPPQRLQSALRRRLQCARLPPLPGADLDHLRGLGRAERLRLLRLLPRLRLPRRRQVLDPGRADSRRAGDRQSGRCWPTAACSGSTSIATAAPAR